MTRKGVWMAHADRRGNERETSEYVERETEIVEGKGGRDVTRYGVKLLLEGCNVN